MFSIPTAFHCKAFSYRSHSEIISPFSEFSCVEMGESGLLYIHALQLQRLPFISFILYWYWLKRFFWRGGIITALKFHNRGQIRWSSGSLIGLTRPPSLSHCPFFSLCSSHVELCVVLSYIVYFLIFALILLFIRMCY